MSPQERAYLESQVQRVAPGAIPGPTASSSRPGQHRFPRMPVVVLEAACGEAAAIRSIHTTFGNLTTRRVITIAADPSIVETAKLRLEHGVSSLSVIDAPHHAVNIVSEHEFCVS